MLNTCQSVLKAITGKLKPRIVGLFRVEAQMGANTFKIILPATMQVHLVFNISHLRPYQGNYRPPGPIEIEGEAEYKIKKTT